MKATFLVGMIGFILSLGVLVVSLLLPVVTSGRTSWREAMVTIIPGALCSFVFLVVMLIGLFLMLSAMSDALRRRRPEDDWPEEEDRPRRRRSDPDGTFRAEDDRPRRRRPADRPDA